MAFEGDSDSDGLRDVAYNDFAFYMFALAMLSVVVTPWTIYKIRQLLKKPGPGQTLSTTDFCACSNCQKKARILVGRRKRWYHSWARPLNVLLILSWLLMAFLLVEVIKSSDVAAPFDPFEILGVSSSATPDEVRSAYHRLSRVVYPDVNRDDPEASVRFILIAKAYKALTDDVARENYKKYGNPDGYQGTKFGIGLPSVVVEKSGTVLLVYFLSIIVVFPSIVCVWWQSQSYKLQTSINAKTYIYFREVLSHTGRFRDLVCAYASAFEFEPYFKKENVRSYMALAEHMKKNDKFDLRKARLLSPHMPYMIQNVVLLNAHINRMEIPDNLALPMTQMLEWVEPLTTAMADSNATVMRRDAHAAYERGVSGFTSRILQALNVSQSLCQATNERDSVLLQLPHFTPTEVKFCNGKMANARTVYDFSRLDQAVWKKVLRSFSDDEFLDLREFCQRYPQASLEVANPRVEDEEDPSVQEFDSVTLDVKLNVARQKGSAYVTCAWRLPQEKPEVWWLILSDKDRDLPLVVRRLQPKDADGEGNYAAELKFMAGRRGKYEYALHAICDCYVGCDVTETFAFNVLQKIETQEDTRYFDTGEDSDLEQEQGESSESDGDDESEETSASNSSSDASSSSEESDSASSEGSESDEPKSDEEVPILNEREQAINHAQDLSTVTGVRSGSGDDKAATAKHEKPAESEDDSRSSVSSEA